MRSPVWRRPWARARVPSGALRLVVAFGVTSVGVVGVVGVVAAGPTGAAGASRAHARAAAAIDWRDCDGAGGADGGGGADGADGVECGTLTVALDDTNPDDDRIIDLALMRVPALDPDRRIGSLLVNPGGPGVPGADFAGAIAASLPDDVQDRFDIVGWDPRGTGASAGIDCTDDLDGLYALDWDPDTAAERDELEAANRAFVDDCVRTNGDLLPFVSSTRTARDMDRIRAALGDDQLTYLGYSYGTYLGAQYAAQFPDRVRALVLDGAIDPSLDATAIQIEQSVGFERSLDQFLDDCSRDDDCEFHGGEDVAAAYDELRASLDDDPVPAGDGRGLNGTLFDTAVAQLLYGGEGSWSTLASALAAAEDGDGSEMIFYADMYTGRDSDGTYGDVQDAFQAIGCADGPPVGGIEGLRAIEAQAREDAPRLGASIVNNSMPCAFWPVPAPAPQPLRATEADPILVLGTRDDPATPLVWARGLARQLGSARLVTVGGNQHTAFASGNACVDKAVVRYVVDQRLPRPGKRC